MAEKVLDLGGGLELWRFGLDELREQDVNARTMSKGMFDRLAATIGRDERLESLPFIAKTAKGFEIVSGHHRVRAARASGKVTSIYGIVDVTGLSRSQIAAKQLAHNAISGTDDKQLLQRIYASIDDVNAKLESYIDPKAVEAAIIKTPIQPVALNIDYHTALITFMPSERDRWNRACEQVGRALAQKADSIYLADLARLSEFKQVVKRLGRDYDVRSLGTIFSTLAELALGALGEPLADEPRVGYVPLVELFGAAMVPPDVAEAVRLALGKLESEGEMPGGTKLQALKRWAEAEMSHAARDEEPSANGAAATDGALAVQV